MENCVCIMRNLSYHVHKEVPGAEKYQDPSSLQAPGSTGTHRKKKDDAGCFGGKKAKGRSLPESDVTRALTILEMISRLVVVGQAVISHRCVYGGRVLCEL